jgi:O-antigen ligase
MQYALLAAVWYIGFSKTDFVFWKVALVFLGAVAVALRDRPRMLAWLSVLLASSLLSVDPKLSVLGAHEEWAWGFLPAVLFCLLTGYRTKGNWLKWLGVALSVHCLLQRVNLDPIVKLKDMPLGYSTAWIGSHIDAGVMIAMSSPVMGRWLPLGLLGLWATHSRSGMVGCAFALCPKRFRVFLLPLFLAPFFMSTPKDAVRLDLWRIAIEGWREKPLLGQGPGTYLYTFHRLKPPEVVEKMGPVYAQGHAHNDLLEALCTTGILGLIAYLVMVVPFLGDPSLLALFVALKFNPVGFETMACAALVAANAGAPLLLRRKPKS